MAVCFKNPTAICVHRSKAIQKSLTIEELKGLEVTMVEGYAVYEIVKNKYPWMIIKPCKNDIAGLLEVSFGVYDAMLVDLTMASYLIEKHGIENLRVAGYTDILLDLGFASRKDLPILNSILEKGLSLITQQERDVIYKKWIHLEGEQFDWTLVVVGFSLVISGLGIVLLWSLSLKRQVSQRTYELQKELEERRQAEKALQVSENKFRQIYNNILDVYYEATLDGKILEISPSIEKHSQYTREELIGKSLYDLYTNPLDRDELIEIIINKGRVTDFEINLSDKDGTQHICSMNIELIKDKKDNPVKLVGLFRDITERKHTIVALEASETRHSKMVANIGDVIVVIDQDGINRYKSANIEKLFGWKPEDVVGVSTWENIHPDDLESTQKFIGTLMLEPNAFGTTECRYKCKDGSYSWIEFTGTNLLYDPDINGLLGNYHDISKRKKVEEALIENEYLFKESQRAAAIGSYRSEFSPNDRWVTSEVLDQIFGMDANYNKTVQGWTELLHPDSAEEMIRYVTEDVIGKNLPFNKEYKIIRQTDGETRWVLGTGKTILDEKGIVVGLIGTIQDITEIKMADEEREKLQSQLAQIQKMESIGNLAGGIAHDFNNLLFPIIGMAEMLLEDLPQDSLEHKNVQEIFNAGGRAGDLVKQILAFSRQSEHKMVPVPVQNILKEVLKLCRSTIPANIEINEEIQQNCWLVMADPTQVHQVAMNLITNALHAIEEKNGIIDIELKQITLKKNEMPDGLLQSGQYVRLSVSDNGIGMTQSTINNIFEPYFTTKEKGKGTGLGLAVVYGIIKEHKGEVKVYSEIGNGTTFNIYLPLMEKSSDIVSVDKVSEVATGTENILLVDDEVSVAKLEGQILSRLGYKVTVKTSSRDALNAFRSNPNSFDMVISDMTMPDMTGDQLSKEILSINPDTPIVICTGFSERINKDQAETIGVKGFLMKPVLKLDMAQMVRKVLDESKIPDGI